MALAHDPAHSAWIRMVSGQYPESRRCHRHDPFCFLIARKPEEALLAIDRQQANYPDWIVHYLRGRAEFLEGEYPAAMAHFELALNDVPDTDLEQGVVHRDLGKACSFLYLTEKAQQHLKEAEQLLEQSGNRYALAKCLIDFVDLELDGSSPTGMSVGRSGDLDKAEEIARELQDPILLGDVMFRHTENVLQQRDYLVAANRYHNALSNIEPIPAADDPDSHEALMVFIQNRRYGIPIAGQLQPRASKRVRVESLINMAYALLHVEGAERWAKKVYRTHLKKMQQIDQKFHDQARFQLRRAFVVTKLRGYKKGYDRYRDLLEDSERHREQLSLQDEAAYARSLTPLIEQIIRMTLDEESGYSDEQKAEYIFHFLETAKLSNYQQKILQRGDSESRSLVQQKVEELARTRKQLPYSRGLIKQVPLKLKCKRLRKELSRLRQQDFLGSEQPMPGRMTTLRNFRRHQRLISGEATLVSLYLEDSSSLSEKLFVIGVVAAGEKMSWEILDLSPLRSWLMADSVRRNRKVRERSNLKKVAAHLMKQIVQPLELPKKGLVYLTVTENLVTLPWLAIHEFYPHAPIVVLTPTHTRAIRGYLKLSLPLKRLLWVAVNHDRLKNTGKQMQRMQQKYGGTLLEDPHWEELKEAIANHEMIVIATHGENDAHEDTLSGAKASWLDFQSFHLDFDHMRELSLQNKVLFLDVCRMAEQAELTHFSSFGFRTLAYLMGAAMVFGYSYDVPDREFNPALDAVVKRLTGMSGSTDSTPIS